jgi:peptidase E
VGLTDFTALNLVPFLLSVHYVDDYKEILKEAMSKTKYKVRILTDKQAIFIIGDEIKFVGGEEIKL